MTSLSDNLPATKAAQEEANAVLADLLAKLIADPASETKLEAVREAAAATSAKLDDVLAKLSGDPASETKLEAVRLALAGLKTGDAADPVYGVQRGLVWNDVSIAALSAGQAAGTTAVLVSAVGRKGLMFNPPADCLLKISTAAGAGGWPLYGGVPNSIVGQPCPTNALYITGLATGQAVGIWEA